MFVPDDPVHRAQQLVQRNAAAGRDVDDLAGRLRRLAGAQHAVDDVGDVGEVARLLAVAVDDRLAVLEKRRREERDDAGVRRSRILPRTEDVEVANRHRLEAVQPREHLAVLFGDELLQRVRRQRSGRHVLALRQRRRVAVGGRRAGVDEALHPASRAATSTFSDASMLARFDVTGSLTERGTDGIAAWCST